MYIDSEEKLVIPKIEKAPKQKFYPASFQQQRIWFTSLIDNKGNLWNEYFNIKIDWPVDVLVLEQSIFSLVKRHSILRTNFKTIEGDLNLNISKEVKFNLLDFDFSDLSDDAIYINFKETLQVELSKSFDLEKGPIIKFLLFKLGKDLNVLSIIRHYLISDAISDSIIVNDLFFYYNTHYRKLKAELPKIPLEYHDYAYWQKGLLGSAFFNKQKSYWLNELQGNVTVLNMPTDYRRPQELSFDSFLIKKHIGDKRTNELKRKALINRVPLSSLLLSAFYLLIHKYSNQNNIIIGNVFAGRTIFNSLQKIPGIFTNALPLSIDFSNISTTQSLLQTVYSKVHAAYLHQLYPFELIVKDLNYKRDASHSPVFQILFNYIQQKTDYNSVNIPFNTSEPEDFKNQFDIELRIAEYNNDIVLDFIFNKDLYKVSTAERICEKFISLLGSISEKNSDISEISIINETEKEQILKEFNSVDYSLDPIENIYDIFLSQALKTPNKCALVYNNNQVTYNSLNSIVDNISEVLVDKGVTKNTIVGLYLNRSIEYIASILAVIKCGGVYVPIVPSYPSHLIDYIIKDLQVDIILSEKADVLPNYSGELIPIDEDLMRPKPKKAQKVNSVRNDLICVMYTSGSTGKPKGIVLNNTGIINRLNWMWTHFPFGDDEVYICKTSLGFVDSMLELFCPLVGVTNVIISDEEAREPRLLYKYIERYSITRLVAVPSLLNLLLDEIEQFGTEKRCSLKYAFSSGEFLHPELVLKWNKLIPDSKLVNIYGSTEVTGDASFYRVTEKISDLVSIPIGKPLPNTQIVVLDKSKCLLPVGVYGYLYISGKCMSCGYLNKPELTHERFIQNTFFDSSVLYAIGDIGRFLEDGNIEYKGRDDNQIKIRGYRIEIEGIESVVKSIPEINNAAVVLFNDNSVHSKLVCFFSSGSQISTLSLKQQLQKILPEYMVPSRFIQLDELPKNSSNKIDRVKLKQYKINDLDKRKDVVLPNTKFAKEIYELWKQVLEYPSVSLTDNFFDIGGHSLILSKLIFLLEEKYKVRPEYRDFISNTLGQFIDFYQNKVTALQYKN